MDLGASLIDTAEAYGTEELVGQAIQGIRNRVLIATKVWQTHFRRREVKRAAENSLKRLGTDYIDLYQLHWPNPNVPVEETLGAMEELVDEGKVRFIGVSNFYVAELRDAQAAMTRHKIVSNQLPYSLVDRRIERDLLPYCQENSISVIAYSPLASGVHQIKARDRVGALTKVVAMTGKTEAQVALQWCISRGSVIAIPRSSSIQHIEENCGASGWQLSPEQMRLLEESIGTKGPSRRPGGVEFIFRNIIRRLRPVR